MPVVLDSTTLQEEKKLMRRPCHAKRTICWRLSPQLVVLLRSSWIMGALTSSVSRCFSRSVLDGVGGNNRYLGGRGPAGGKVDQWGLCLLKIPCPLPNCLPLLLPAALRWAALLYCIFPRCCCVSPLTRAMQSANHRLKVLKLWAKANFPSPCFSFWYLLQWPPHLPHKKRLTNRNCFCKCELLS